MARSVCSADHLDLGKGQLIRSRPPHEAQQRSCVAELRMHGLLDAVNAIEKDEPDMALRIKRAQRCPELSFQVTHGRLSWVDGSHLFPMEKPQVTAAAIEAALLNLQSIAA